MKALELVDAYADSVAAHRLESLYGTSKSYTLEKAKERDEAHEALAAELRRLASVEAELERIKALPPEAVRYDFDGYGWQYIDNGSGSDWLTRHTDGEPLYALGSKTC